MVSIRRRLTALETETSSVRSTDDRVAISRLTDAELDAQIEAFEGEIRAAGGIVAAFGEDRDLADQCRVLFRKIGHLIILDT
jgi:hypothetical protein